MAAALLSLAGDVTFEIRQAVTHSPATYANERNRRTSPSITLQKGLTEAQKRGGFLRPQELFGHV